MFLNSVVSEGLAGMQQSHKRMQQSAEQIVKAGVPTDQSVQNVGQIGMAPVTNNGAAVNDLPSTSTVGATTGVESIVEPLIDMKRQEFLFDASATVVKVATDTVGRLIDDIS